MGIIQQDKTIICRDGRKLAGKLFQPVKPIKASVLIAPGTGVKKEFYFNFANYLAESGYAVLAFDYRGIGGSVSGDISSDDALLQDWGQLDLPAALECLKNECPNMSYHLIGHSAGGQLIGLMDNYSSVSSVFNFASSSGCLKNIEFPFSLKASFFLKAYVPISNALFGYTKSELVGMGEPLPKKVAQQWSKWCSDYGYVKNDFNESIKKHHYNDVKIPFKWVHASDDSISNSKNIEDMISVFPKISSEIYLIEPKSEGLRALGHMDYFRRSNKPLWRLATDWLNKHSNNPKSFTPRP